MKPSFREIRDRLRFVGLSRDDYDLSTFPDFFIAGPQRTGTTWLFGHLVHHPHVFIPEQKEIYYFNTLRNPASHPADLPPVDADLGWYLDRFRPEPDHVAARDRECRREFGQPFEPRRRGDATATYAAGLDEDVISEVHTLNPDIKVIVLVRDPVERAWSQAKLGLCSRRDRRVEDVAEAEWLEFFERPYQRGCGHYTAIAASWRRVLPENGLFMRPFREIEERPRELLLDLFGFLGLDADPRYIRGSVTEAVNPTQRSGIPDRFRERLEAMFSEEKARLSDLGLL